MRAAREGKMIARIGFGTAVVAALLALSLPAAAQDTPGETGEDCIAIGTIWGGSSADVARIAEQPVPESFQRTFLGGGCARFSLIVQSLVEWHLAFGNEASTTAALDFLAANMMPDRDYAADLAKRIDAARSAAERDFAR